MKNNYFRHFIATCVLTLTVILGWGQASETFTNIPTASSTSYASRSWTGDNGVAWTATLARTDQTLTGKAICTNGNGTVTSPTYSGGMGVLTFNYVRAFTGTGARSIEVWVNGSKIGSTITVSSTSNTVVGYTGTINISGSVNLELRTSGTHIKIDDISWTAYTVSGNTVTFDANGGTGTMASQSASVPTNLNGNAFSRIGYAFAGWATSAGGSVAYADGASFPFTASATLYAQWTPTPTITVTPTSITGLNYVFGSGPSVGQSYSVSASNLTPAAGNITVTAPTNFSVSTSLGGTYTSSITLAYTGGALASTDVFVRLNAGLAVASYGPSNVSNAGGGATTKNVDVSGTVTAVPDIALSSASPAVAASNVSAGSNDNIIYAFQLDVTTISAQLSAFNFTTSGTALAADITNFKVYYSADAVFNVGSDTHLKTLSSSLGAGSHTVSGLSQTIASGATAYIFITTDLPCSATAARTIIVNAITTTDLTFVSGNKTGTASASGTQTITSATPINVTSLATSACVSGGATVSWTNVTGCYDAYLVVASLTALTTSPSGNGSSYTANTTFGSGTAYDNGYVVKNGTGTTVSITGLSNGTNYTYTVFTRTGTTWSSGVAVNCTPTISYCSSYGNTFYSTGTVNVSFNTINNTSGSSTDYEDYTSISTTVDRTVAYNLSVSVNTAGSFTVHTLAWIDWNQDGVFNTSTEEYDLGTANSVTSGTTSLSPLSITIPATATLGNTRMRVSTKYNSDPTPCAGTFDGEVEDYTINVNLPCTPAADPVGAISGTTPACTSTLLTYAGADAANAYWQTTAAGISTSEPVSSTTKTVSASGTHYVRIYDGTCWSAGTVNKVVVINPTTAITTNPVDAYAVVGNTASFNVAANGVGLSYQWQQKIGVGSWTNVGTNSTSYTTPATTLAMDGYQYQVIVTGTCGNATSSTAILTVGTVPLCDAPLLEENFVYGPCEITDFSTSTEAMANWSFVSNGTDPLKYNPTSLSYTGYPSSGIGGSAEYEGGGDDDFKREISSTGVSTGAVYTSFLLNITGAGSLDYFFSFMDNHTTPQLYGRVNMRSSGSGYQLGITKYTSSVVWNTPVLTYNTTYLVVVKNEFVAGGANDVLKMWIISGAVPATETAAGTPISATTSDTDPVTSIKYITVRQTGKENGLVDGIRVATSWESLFCDNTAATTTYTWTGASSTSWSNASNWSPNGIPKGVDNIIINTPGTNVLNITDCRAINNFTLNGTGTFSMASTGVFSIEGDVTYGGTATATLDCESQIFIKSSNSQPIPPLTYGNLDILGGNRVFSPTGVIKICNVFNVVPDPSTNIYTVTGSTVEYISSQSGWTMTPFTYDNLTFSGTGDFSLGYSSPAVNKNVNVLGNYLQTNGTVYLGETSSKTASINVDGNMTISGGTFDVNHTSGGTGVVTLKGDLTVASSAQLFANNATTATFNFAGIGDGLSAATTQAINVASTNTEKIDFKVKSGAYVQLTNQDFNLATASKLTVENGGTFDFGFNGTTALNVTNSGAFTTEVGSTLKITSTVGLVTTGTTGNVQTNTRTFTSDGIYHFIGKANQVTGSALPATARQIVMDMENVDEVTLTNAVSVTQNVDFIKGHIVSTNTELLSIENGSTATNASDNSYVSGPIRKIGTQAFVFPVGKSGNYQAVGISAPAVVTDHFTAEYFQADPHPTYNESSKDGTIDHISSCEYWILNRTNGSSNVEVSLTWDGNSCGVTNLSDLLVARWDGSTWKDHGNGATTGTLAAGTVTTSGSVSSFSPFTLASKTTLNPLPVELLFFEVESKDQDVLVSWATVTEINNDFFTVERSTNGKDFEAIGEVKGAGNYSGKLDYMLLDKKTLSGISYYRLKQTDYDGSFEYSDIRTISRETASFEIGALYPNPTNNIINIPIAGNLYESIDVKVYDMVGSEINLALDYSNIHLLKLNVSSLLPGNYVLRLSTSTKSKTMRFIKN